MTQKLTAKGVGNKLLPQIRQLRKTLQKDLDSLKYLRTRIEGGDPSLLDGERRLDVVEDQLETTERHLRSIGGV